MSRDLALAVTIGARLASSFRASMDAARAGIRGVSSQALTESRALSERLMRRHQVLREYLQRTDITAANRSRAEDALRGVARRQAELHRNERALAAAMERGNALAETRGRIFSDMAKLSAAGAALAVPAGMAVGAAAQKQDTIVDIAITGDMNEKDQEKLSASVRETARLYNQTQTEVLQGAKVLVAGGIQSREELEAYSAKMAYVATATRASMDDLGASTLALRDNLGISSKDIGKAFNVLVAGSKAGLVEMKDMAKFLPQLTPAVASLGLTGIDAASKIVAALEVARIGAGTEDEAANNMKNYLSKITAGDTIKRFADAGIDLEGSLQQLAKDGIDPFEGSIRLVMEYMKSQSPQAAAEFKKAMQTKDDAERERMLKGLGESFALSELFGDMQAMNFLRAMIMNKEKYRSIKSDALESADKDAMRKDFDVRMASPLEQAKQLYIEFDLAAESLGKALLPSALAVGQALVPLIQRGADWMEQNQETVVLVAKVAAGLLAFRGGLLALRLGFTLLGGPVVSAAVKFLTFRSLLAAGARPLSALLRLFGMSPRMVGLFTGILGRAGSAARTLGAGILRLGRALGGALVRGLTLAGRALLVLGRALLLNPVGLLATGIAVAAYLIYKNWDRIRAAFSAGWNWLKGLGSRLLQWGRNLAASIFPEGGVSAALEVGWNAVKASFQKGIVYLGSLPGKFLEMGKNLASGLVEGIKSGIAAAGDAVAGMAESVKNKFKGWLGIASPSRVFAGYGLNVAQGAALGIKAGEDAAASASAGLASAAARGWTAPKLAAPELPSVGRPGTGWRAPDLLTSPDGPAKIAAASRDGGREGFGQAGVSVQFSPTITIQGSATEKDVRGALAMTLPELERMIRRLMHDRERRAYV